MPIFLLFPVFCLSSGTPGFPVQAGARPVLGQNATKPPEFQPSLRDYRSGRANPALKLKCWAIARCPSGTVRRSAFAKAAARRTCRRFPVEETCLLGPKRGHVRALQVSAKPQQIEYLPAPSPRRELPESARSGT